MSARGLSHISPSGGDDEIYEVERILKKRRHPSKGVMYFVKWRNFPNSANTWEPACNFSQKLIEIYESKHRRGRKSNNVKSSSAVKLSSASSSATINRAAVQAKSPIVNNDNVASTTIQQQHLTPSTSLALSSSPTSTIISNSSTESGSHQSSDDKTRAVGRPRKNSTQHRQQQVQLQLNIQEKQQTQIPVERHQLAVFNPVSNHYLPIVKEVVYEPELSKEPIIVTDVTLRHQTVTISECMAPEGFFSNPI